MTDKYDVVVIGAGPAGYVAAIRAAQLGLKTACVDDWRNGDTPALGGTCLNAGCIPSKVLLEVSALYARLAREAREFGLRLHGLELDLAALQAYKERIVRELGQGIEALLRANGVVWFPARGRLLAAHLVAIEPATAPGETRRLEAAHVILATGSLPAVLDKVACDGRYVVDSSGALAFREVPKRLGVIGAGVIGLELGSVWRRLGAEVVLLEAQDVFLPLVDEEIAREALRLFRAQGLDIRLGARVTDCRVSDGEVEVIYEDARGRHRETFDRLIVAVGRRANSAGLAAEEAGLLLDEWGLVHVDEHCRTNLPGVYAIGDLVRGPMLAHKGSAEGVMVAERIAGRATTVNYDAIPAVIYTEPEIAWVGKTEQQLRAEGVRYRSGVFPFAAASRARLRGETGGRVKILAAEASDRLLGMHIIGPQASELIAQGVMALEFGAAAEDLALTVFAHPSLSEAVHEAALAVAGEAIHVAHKRPPRPKE
jgi:dihydrolipoamide dehydrogenase